MRMIVAAAGMTLLLTGAALAQTQDQCGQVRAAVAQYGYKAARAHAVATLSPNEVRVGDACLKHKSVARKRKGHPHAARLMVARLARGQTHASARVRRLDGHSARSAGDVARHHHYSALIAGSS